MAPSPFISVQSLSCVRLFATPWTAARQASLSITNSGSSLKFMSIESVMSSNHLIFCHPLLLPPPIFPSIRIFSNESALPIRWPKYWTFSISISPSNEHSGLISFRMDWLDLLVVQGTLKSLLQHHSSKASILQHAAVFIVHLSHPILAPCWIQFCLPSWITVGWCLGGSSFFLATDDMILCAGGCCHFLHSESLCFFSYFFLCLSSFFLCVFNSWHVLAVLATSPLLLHWLSDTLEIKILYSIQYWIQ